MIRVICADISGLDDAAYKMLYEKASPERKNKADRYRKREDALRCVAADALLCHALGTDRYTVRQRENGKPYIPERPDFHYNLSHSGHWVVIAFGGSEVGVDVERLRGDTDIQAVSARFFSEEEQQYVREDPARSRFFEVWTGKESYVKYLGTGLKIDLSSFSVLSPEMPVHLHRRWIDEQYCLSLCTTDNEYLFEKLDGEQLLQTGL